MRPASLALQNRLLPGVSRTFALTIPQLPMPLRPAITNAYLLCRIADTVEDSTAMAPDEKDAHYQRLLEGLSDPIAARKFSEALLDTRLVQDPLERELIVQTPGVLLAFGELPVDQQRALRDCLTTMCNGMANFERLKNPYGLEDSDSLRDYCYVAAGCVGEMLTRLFADINPKIHAQREELRRLSLAFGQGLQLTNILKDVWDDRQRNICWLPRDVFEARGIDLRRTHDWQDHPGYRDGIRFLVAVAHHHLRQAQEYTLRIPASEVGIRRFCSWSIGMALSTLRNIADNPGFTAGEQVKISRRRLRMIVATNNLTVVNDMLLRGVFRLSCYRLPSVQEQELGRLQAGHDGNA
ncbi:phytoene/squalene synthase family protein [Halomonas chromatireducens]|uniref:All-trans-phytoene synthase/15-cis-phytoene synthase n=1 Tax=Halomonas chromatireducens TaxID=507626 RepID=A0A120JWR3_9GAMM|nr:phytoene/squalene synthase family protein [Halomonas chromatireducens]AMD02394.1 All-trans-phytoene synthase/15-cis-phytoene synthase [Halomonas chromatireducens]